MPEQHRAIRMLRVVTILVPILSVSMVAVATAGDKGQTAVSTAACLIGRSDEAEGVYTDVWVEGNYAYIPTGTSGDVVVSVIDISDPANPVLDETLLIPFPPNAFGADLKAGDGLLFVVLNVSFVDGVAIYDVRNPASRHLVATVRIAGFEGVHNLFYDNGFLYLASFGGFTSLAIVDLTSFDPDNPPQSPITEAKWVVENIGTSQVHDITVRNGRMYVAAWDSGLWIYDVSDVSKTAPTFLGSVEGNATHSAWPTDDGRFVVVGEERPAGGIQVYEISESNGSLTLTLTDSLVLPDAFSVHNQVIVGYRLYNSWYEQGLQVFDINPMTGQLEFVASFDSGNNWGVYPLLGEDRILVSDIDNGLFVVSLLERECLASSEPELKQIPATVGGPLVDLTGNRMIGLNAGNAGQTQVIRIELVDLPGAFAVWNGTEMWVKKPQDVCSLPGVDNPDPAACTTASPLFKIAGLTCDPGEAHATDWSLEGEFYVAHPGIVPDGLYEVQIVDSLCDRANECDFSTAIFVQNSVFGDISGGFDSGVPLWVAPDGAVGIPTDVLAAIGAFSNTPGNVTKLRADIEPCVLDFKVNISDIVRLLDAFMGLPYSFAPGQGGCPEDPCGG